MLGKKQIGKFEVEIHKAAKGVTAGKYVVRIYWNSGALRQFVSSYFAGTLLETPERKTSLKLQADVPQWTMNPEEYKEMVEFIQVKIKDYHEDMRKYSGYEAAKKYAEMLSWEQLCHMFDAEEKHGDKVEKEGYGLISKKDLDRLQKLEDLFEEAINLYDETKNLASIYLVNHRHKVEKKALMALEITKEIIQDEIEDILYPNLED